MVVMTLIRTEKGEHFGHTKNFKTHLFGDGEKIFKGFVRDGIILRVGI